MDLMLKENRRVREAAEVTRAEAEALRQQAKQSRARRPKPAGRVCPVCERPLQPGHPVSFRSGALGHLARDEKGARRP